MHVGFDPPELLVRKVERAEVQLAEGEQTRQNRSPPNSHSSAIIADECYQLLQSRNTRGLSEGVSNWTLG